MGRAAPRPAQGFFQYGLLADRAFHSNNLFTACRHHALRLGSVVSLNPRRLEPHVQSHFFDACEQLTVWLKAALEEFVPLLLGMDIGQVTLRLYASPDRVGFDLASWVGLEEAYDEFMGVLSDKVSPSPAHHLTPRS